jgi:hypothetical protein
VRRPRVAPVPTIPDLQLTADRALSLHRPTRWQAQGQLCACRSLSLSLLPEVTSLDLHATEIAADRAMHPSTGSGQALRQAQGRPFGRLRAGPSAGSGQAFTDWLAHVRNSAFHRLRCACRGLARRSNWRRPAQRLGSAAWGGQNLRIKIAAARPTSAATRC